VAFAAEFGLDVEGAEVDVVVLHRRQVGGGLVGDLGTLTAQRVERIGSPFRRYGDGWAWGVGGGRGRRCSSVI